MLVSARPITYVDPFDRICLGLGKPATTDLKEAFLVYQIPSHFPHFRPNRTPQRIAWRFAARSIRAGKSGRETREGKEEA